MKKQATVVICLGLLLFSPAYSKNISSISEAYQKGISYCTSDLDSALYYFGSMASIAKKEGEYDSMLLAQKWLIQCAGDFNIFPLQRKFLTEIDMAFEEVSHSLPTSTREGLEIDLKALWAGYYLRTGNYEKAIHLNEAVIQTILSNGIISIRDSFLLFRSHSFVAQIYKNTGNYHAAIRYYREGLNYIKSDAEQQQMGRKGLSLAQIAICFQRMGDNENAARYYKLSLRDFNSHYPSKESSIQFRLNKNLLTGYQNVARFYLSTYQPDSAIYVLNKTLKLDYNPLIRTSFDLLAEAYISKHNWPEAKHYLDISLGFKNETLGPDHYSLGITLTLFGVFYAEQMDWQAALKYFEQGEAKFCDFSNSNFSQVTAKHELLETLLWKCRALYHLSSGDGPAVYLVKGKTTTTRALRLMNEIRHDFEEDWDKQLMLHRRYELYEWAMEFAWMADPEEDEELFSIAESGKATLLHDAYQQQRKRAKANLPPKLMEREERVSSELQTLKASSHGLAILGQIPENRQRDIFHKQRQLTALRDSIHSLQNGGLQQDEHSGIVCSREAQSMLKPDQAMIEYFLGHNVLYIFLVTRKQFMSWRKDIPDDFIPSIDAMRTMIEEPVQRANLITQKNLHKVFGKIYDLVLQEPIASLPHEIHHLTIVPDGELAFIPFEALHPDRGNIRSENDIPYLLKKYNIHYAGSAKLLKSQLEIPAGKARKSLAGFVPDYGNMYAELSGIPALNDLQGAREQVEIATGLFNGDAFLGEQASKAVFQNVAPEYRILILAMHALFDSNRPQASGFVFGPAKSPNSDDIILHLDEVQTLKLNAELVVLSACNTGNGELQRGEGLISLSRSFSYAGVPAVIMNLWKAPDRANAKIMKDFFSKLKSGMAKDEALRQAKLGYLKAQKGDLSRHPYFWAGTIASGDMETIAPSGKLDDVAFWLLGSLALMGLLFFNREALQN